MSNRMGVLAILAAAAVTAIPVFTGHSLPEIVVVFILTLGVVTMGLVLNAVIEMGTPQAKAEKIKNLIHAAGICTSTAIVTGGVAIAAGVF